MSFARVGLASLAGVGLVVGGAAGAFGADLPSGMNSINPDGEVSLTLQKFERPAGSLTVGDGNEVDADKLLDFVPLPGVNFEVCYVPGADDSLDLSTNAGWDAYADLQESWGGTVAELQAEGLTGCVEKTTDANGLITWEDDDLQGIGVYVVSETGFEDDFPYDPLMVMQSAPFLVNLPVLNAAGTGWNYDAFVYPKNVIHDLEKFVDDGASVAVGDIVDWTILSSIHNDLDGVTYKVVDAFDSRLTYGDAQKTATTVQIVDKDGAVIDTLELGVDYDITIDPANTATVEILAPGFAKSDENIGDVLKVVFPTGVNDTIAGNLGNIDNQAVYFPNGSYTEGIKSNKPVSKWGGVEITKRDRADNDVTLAGATFELYVANSPLVDGKLPTGAERVTGVPGMTAANHIVTNDSGVAVIEGLRYTDWANNTALSCEAGEGTTIDEDCNFYFLVEVQAPEGYNVLPEPLQFTVAADDTTNLTYLDVFNTKKHNTIQTGGAGVWLSIVVGAGLLGAGIGSYAISRRVKSEA